MNSQSGVTAYCEALMIKKTSLKKGAYCKEGAMLFHKLKQSVITVTELYVVVAVLYKRA